MKLIEVRRIRDKADMLHEPDKATIANMRRLRALREAAEAAGTRPTKKRKLRRADGVPWGGPEDVFWSLVDRSGGQDACHVWGGRHRPLRGGVDQNFGQFKLDGFNDSGLVHRVVIYLKHGRIPPRDRHVTTLCGNSLCVNIEHLAVRASPAFRSALVTIAEWACEAVG